LIIILGLIIGSVSFAGSMIAWGKLNGRIKDFTFNGNTFLNLVLLGIISRGRLSYIRLRHHN